MIVNRVIGGIFTFLGLFFIILGLVIPAVLTKVVFVPAGIVFFVVGVAFLIKDVKYINKNKEIEKNGEECFGLICNHINTGGYVNDKPELKARVHVFIPSLNDTEVIDEVIGLDRNKYPVGVYVKCKYYDGDININNIIDSSEIPDDILKELDKIGLDDE